MKSFNDIYQAYLGLKEKDQDDGLTTDLTGSRVTATYFEQVYNATRMLRDFVDRYLAGNARVVEAVNNFTGIERAMNVKFAVLVDVIRCYDGLDHPTTFNRPEGIALMLVLTQMLDLDTIDDYSQLSQVRPGTLSSLEIIPYLDACSQELGNPYSLFVSSILEQINERTDRLYRLNIYSLCKKIAEVDGHITVAEKEWLEEIARLADDDPSNDIDVSQI